MIWSLACEDSSGDVGTRIISAQLESILNVPRISCESSSRLGIAIPESTISFASSMSNPIPSIYYIVGI